MTEDLRTELYLGQWIDVTADVKVNPGVTITRGRQNEGTRVTTPSVCQFQLRNGDEAMHGEGTYDPRWPLSPYFGIFGKGTPVRVGLRRAWDNYGRTVANGWGTSDAGYAWTDLTAGVSSGAVSGGTATHTVSGAPAYRLSTLVGFRQRDVDLKTTVAVSPANITGGALEPATLCVRYTDANNYNMVRPVFAAGGAISLQLITVVAGVGTDITTLTDGSFTGSAATGLTYQAGARYAVRFLVEGTLYKAKIWPADDPEPFEWQWSARTNANYGPGSVTVRSGVAGGNTNVPVTFTYDELEVRSPRFYGEISSAPQQQDITGKIRTVAVEAADALRRLQTGASPVDSTLRRGIPQLPDLVAYWPMEDGATATQASAETPGTQPMEVSQGTVAWASDGVFEGSDKIPAPKQGTLHGIVPAHTLGYEMVRFLLHVPSSGLTDGQALCTVHTQGSIGRWRLTWHTGGGLKLSWFAANTIALVGDSGVVAFNINDRPVMLSIELWQVGTAINWAWVTVDPGATAGSSISGAIASQTLGRITDVYLTPDKDLQNVSFGHLHIQNAFHSLFDLGPQLNAWRSERDRDRTVRLAGENDVDLATYRSTQTPDEGFTRMGAQQMATLVDLLEDTAQAGLSLIYAAKGSAHLIHRTHPSLQGQDPRAVIDVAGGQLGAAPLPVDDDQALTNDVTATRTGGSSYRATLDSGRNSTASPAEGGIGVYDTSGSYNVANDTYLPDIAGWKLALGTYDGPRYPSLTLLRHARAVAAAASGTLFADVLDVDQGDVLNLAGLPLGDDRAMIFGYRETIGQLAEGLQHTFVFNAGPGDPWNIGVVDAPDVRLDSDSSSLAAAVTATDTTLWVAIAPLAPPWIDSAGFPAEFPFDLAIGGEELTVTAIANNLIPDPGFEAGVTDWFASGGTITQSSTQKHSGSFAARIVPDGSGQVYAQSGLVPVTPGVQLTAAGWVWFTTAVTSSFAMSVNWFDASEDYLSTSSVFVSVPAATWTQASNTFTAPAGAAYAALVPLLGGTPPASQVWYVDDVSLTSPTLQAFTVTRGANGVTTPHTAGDPVHLADPVFIGAGIQT